MATQNLTFRGQRLMLVGDGDSDGSIARLATHIRLLTSAQTPQKDGSGFVEVADGNGYIQGGREIQVDDWNVLTPADDGTNNVRIVLASTQHVDGLVWTADGGTIESVFGMYIVDTDENPLAFWTRESAFDVEAGDTITGDGLFIEIT